MGRKRVADDAASYEIRKAQSAQRSREKSAAGRDIAPIPDVVNPFRREVCRLDFRAYCETYHPARFPLAWSEGHLTAIADIQTCILHGGQFAFAMPRGSGKTSLCEAAALWATLYGHRAFVVVIGSTEAAAEELLDSIRTEVETNDTLLEDFPEVCYPVRRLEGNAMRANMQTCEGVMTRIGWTGKELIYPTLAGSTASGAAVRFAGITGRIRGMARSTADGRKVRPDLVIVDDPQTDESAHSPSQNASREKMLSVILGLAGPGRKIAAVMPCTVIAPGDVADRALDRERHPAWNGRRTRMLDSLPRDEARWEEYARLRAEGLRAGRGLADATAYYAANRVAMDEGAKATWEARHNPDELSAIQHAMNLRLADPAAFAAEYQNDPFAVQSGEDAVEIDSDTIASRTTRIARGVVPKGYSRLTAAIDVQGKVLYWTVTAWNDSFGGAVVDYGTFPRQNRAYFESTDARPSLADLYPGVAIASQLYSGLNSVVSELMGRNWRGDNDEGQFAIESCLIDAGWGEHTATVYEFISRSPHRALLLPSKGVGIGAGRVPMSEWSRKDGERIGLNWRLRAGSAGQHGRLLLFDTNHWKTFIAERLAVAEGAPGGLWLFGDRPYEHQLFADHLCAEYRVRTHGRGRTVDEWTLKAHRPDNHWFDCLTMSAVAASVRGIAWNAVMGAGETPAPGRKKVRLSEIQKQKAGRR